MIRKASLIALAFFAFVSYVGAQGFGGMFPGPGTAHTSSSYQGPGDVTGYGSAYAYWGLRCYKSSYTGNVADILDNATGLVKTTLTCSSGGTINQTVNPLSTTCSGACYVNVLYDQTGNGRDVTSAGNSALFLQSGAGFTGYVINMQDSNLAAFRTASAPAAQSQPITASVVVKMNTTVSTSGILTDGTFNTMFFWINTANTFGDSAPSNASFTGIADNSWGAVQTVLQGSSTTMNAANAGINSACTTFNTGNPGTNGIAGTNKLTIGAMTDAPSVPMDGYLFEAMIVLGAVSQANQTSLCQNQRLYGGF